MSEADIQDIMRFGGPAALLIFLLVTAVIVLWKHYLAQAKIWTENQIEDTRSMSEVAERSANAIANMVELLKTSSASNTVYQTEMRSKVDTILNVLSRLEVLLTRRRER